MAFVDFLALILHLLNVLGYKLNSIRDSLHSLLWINTENLGSKCLQIN